MSGFDVVGCLVDMISCDRVAIHEFPPTPCLYLRTLSRDKKPHAQPLYEWLRQNAQHKHGHAFHHVDLLVVTGFDAVKDEFWTIDFPAPGGPYRISTMTPAKDAFIGI